MRDKWYALGLELRHMGVALDGDCCDLGRVVELDERFDRLYYCYTLLLELLKTYRHHLSRLSDEGLNVKLPLSDKELQTRAEQCLDELSVVLWCRGSFRGRERALEIIKRCLKQAKG